MRSSRFVRALWPAILSCYSAQAFGAACVSSFLFSGCGGGFEPGSKLTGLRVLALQKEPPYPHPGETVELKLLYWDGKTTEGAPRKLQFTFLECDNPPGDLYYACFGNKLMLLSEPGAPDGGADSSAEAGAPDAGDASTTDDAGGGFDASGEGGVPAGDAPIVTKRLVIPARDEIILKKDPIDYGLRYVFFTACAGHIAPTTPGNPNELPVGCFDDAGQKLGPDDFVPGYSAIYVYDTLRNANPVVAPALEITSPEPPRADGIHVPRCTASDRSACPTYDVKPVIDIDQSAESDPASKDANGNVLKEQIWVAYYSTDGDFTSSLRLVNDATTGPNLDHGTKFRAPSTSGTVHLFGVVHDNRGGVAWALGKVVVD